LSLVGRPDNEDWCGIRILVDGPDGSWTATSRCLQIDEVSRIADWLANAASDPAFSGRLDYVLGDNRINFELRSAQPRQLRIFLEWDLRPLKDRELPMEEFFRDYPVSTTDLQRAAELLREELRKAIHG
jgi:hypothetical protein